MDLDDFLFELMAASTTPIVVRKPQKPLDKEAQKRLWKATIRAQTMTMIRRIILLIRK
jgi:hypothetical protein